MAVLAIVTSSPPSVEGGHLVIARSVLAAARECGHDAHLVITPDYGFGRQTSSYLANWLTDVRTVDGRKVDQVISFRYPSYAVRHPVHVCWLLHTMREYYDLWPRFSATISTRARVKERVRRAVTHAADRWLLARNVTKLFALSTAVQRRIADSLHVDAEVLHPPPPPRAYRCDGYGDYIFSVSRLTPLKRMDLLIRALAEPGARGIRAVIAGEGESKSDLERLAASLGVGDRVTLPGRIDDAVLIDHLARCGAVCFTPFDEDYGFVTVEAFASRKPVVTCRDSGGPTEIVRHRENGLVCEPTPQAVAGALAQLIEDRRFAERLGERGAADVAAMSWAAAVKRLVIV